MKRFLLGLAVLTAGCATTQILASWKSPSAEQIHFEKVAVFALAKDPATRRIAEDEIVRGSPPGKAVASYAFISDADLGDVPAVKQKLRESGFDGAVVVRPIGTQVRETVVPGAPLPPLTGPYGTLSGYYGYAWPGAYAPGTVVTDRYVTVEVLVYSVPKDELLWGARSESANPASVNALVRDVAKAAREDLRSQGLLP